VRIVLDTNVLVSGLFWTGIPSKILEYWINDHFELILSDEIYDEYTKTLFRISKGKKDDLVGKWLILFAEHSSFVTINKRVKLSADPDDDKFIECAIAGKAKYIVSGDSHLLDLKSILNIEIITPAVFLENI
jgi:uncharacterized protein